MNENRTASFYGNVGVSSTELNQKIEENNTQIEELINEHVVASETQPTTQRSKDIWLVLAEAPTYVAAEGRDF